MSPNVEFASKEPIAVIGMGCVLPDAPDVATFWANLLAGKSSIREVPKARWDADLFWTADRSAPDKTYAKIGAFVADDAFNPLDFRMLPTALVQIDPSQRWALSATRQALKDAGYKTGLKADEGATGPGGKPPRDFDRNRVAVILGNAMGGELMKLHTKRLYWPQFEAALRQDTGFQKLSAPDQEAVLRRTETIYKSDVPPVTEDSMPGTLSNVAAGRIANVFDLSGKNFTTDAACASSLAALDSAIDTLRKGEADYVVWGGTDRSMDVTPYVEFSKIGALSADGSRPFDANANGFVMGEGCAMFLLKRLSDAERDGDKVYAVVRGVGGSSDGKGKGITAPNPVGQVKAVVRAYEDAGVDPFTIGYLEAHGTSTPVGDPVELTSAEEAFRNLSNTQVPSGSIAVGSVKSNMGHLKSAAGAVGLLKAAMALKEGVIPPSINVRTINPRIDWAKSAFKVATARQDWQRPATGPRRAAVSSFGFGGTNFHVVLEEHIPGSLKVLPGQMQVQHSSADPMRAPATSWSAGGLGTASWSGGGAGSSSTPLVVDIPALVAAAPKAQPLESEPLVLDGASAMQAAGELLAAKATFWQDGQGQRLRDVVRPHTERGLAAPTRVATSLASPGDLAKKLDLAQKAATNPAQARLAFQQGVFLGKGKPQGKVAFLFPGQGTQYVNMLRDVAQKYEVVRKTFEEADQILLSELGGVKLTDILWPTPDTPEAQAASDKKLQLTEYTQPAVLAADVALLRLLRQWGIEPDVVAGHSLGEYGALVAAGVLSFADALHAVAARGREMAHVEVPDLGKMASVSADWHAVEDALKGLTEYVIPANKNCPSQTVIAGSSKGVDQAVALLQQRGLQAQYLPVSAAFHSAIVAPASKPLRNVLARLDVKAPKVRVLSNVGSRPYEADVEWIRDNLATQVASPVEWIGIIERMHAEGVRTFIEVGPKLALTNFVRDILKEQPDAVAIGANHPKKGGITHVNELFAFLGAWGFQPKLPALDDASVYTAAFRDPAAGFRRATAPTSHAAIAASTVAPHPVAGRAGGISMDPTRQAMTDLAATLKGYLEREGGGQAPSGHASSPSVGATSSSQVALETRLKAFGICLDDIGVSGISVGLPGRGKELFDAGDWDRILRGDNLIEPVPAATRQAIADKNIVRLVKGGDGSAQFQAVNDISQVIQLAAQRGSFNLADWGVGKDLIDSLDVTFQYAIAAGLEALHDAGIPLQRTYLQTSTGSFLPKEWKLPVGLRDETGVIFASAFPGYDNLVRDLSRYLADRYAGRTREEFQTLYNDLIGAVGDSEARGKLQAAFDREYERLKDVLPEQGAARYEFNRKFLFNVLSMGHSQLAQLIGARGPNTQVNAACASTTQALGIAEDWIRTGRCRRVVVVGADDITNENLFEWFGAGFLAAGAATTKSDVREAALPFDRRRHGMIVGMGAVGMIVEATPETEKRGMRPIARLLATRVSNSAFHGSRLDVDHIASEMTEMMRVAGQRYGVVPATMAAKTLFMSHETYTPARGGSAAAEIHALRAAFGPAANKVVVANTKGFTGHPQGASIEDAIALKCLQRGQVPPIANLREPDPELGDLNLSKGGAYDLRYAVRLAAGFGSQIALALFELASRENERVSDPIRQTAWLAAVSGVAGARTEVKDRTLRIVDQGPPAKKPKPVAVIAPLPAPVAAPPAAVSAQVAPAKPSFAASVATTSSASSPDASAILTRLLAMVQEKTGYPPELLDPELDMEADLGIDTVKQAELFGMLRDAYGLAPEDGIQIKDYNTLRKVAGYVASRLGGATATGSGATPGSSVAPSPAGTEPATTAHTQALAAPQPVSSQGLALPPSHSIIGDAPTGVLDRLLQLVGDKTGYPRELLDPDLDMEADLGIDTVKQAELFGAIRDAYTLPPEEGIQIKDYPTLRKVAGYVETRLGGRNPAGVSVAQPATASTVTAQASPPSATAAVLAATPQSAPPPSSGGLDPDAVLTKVTELVAAKTGYPADMLQPDLDMEADLGIDTVKQAELFGEVRAAFAIAPIEGMMLKDYPTLRKVAGFVLAASGQSAASTATPPASAATAAVPAAHPAATNGTLATPSAPSSASAASVGSAGSAAPAILRRAPFVRPAALPGSANALQRGNVLVLGDADEAMLEAFRKSGFHPGRHATDPVGVLFVSQLPGGSAAERAGALFDAAKTHRNRLGVGSFVCVVTRQDGAHGLKSPRDPAMAALAGIGKALRKELPAAITKVIDFHPDAQDAPRLVVDELLRGGTRTEVAFDAAGLRHHVEVGPAPLAPATPSVSGSGIVVSGGAQGITVEMLAALAPQGARFLLLGRTDQPDQAATWSAWDEAAWKAEEARTVADLKGRGEKATPVAVQKAVEPKRKAAEVHRNLARLQAAGAQVLYAPLDVTNAADVGEAVAWARGLWGRIDGVIHAAGMEVSKDLASKDRKQFDAVFAVKAAGWNALMEATKSDPLAFVGAFGSVAGRFGNVGQTDYSAANEFLAKAVALEARRRSIATAFTIAWGPWGEVGMATKGSILQIMHASGVTPIPTAEGVAHFLTELATPGVRECVVAGALGAIDVDGQVVGQAPDAALDAVERVRAAHPERFRLLDGIESIEEGRRIVATLRLDQGTDPYLRDHRVDGVPYLPGVFGLEAFAEAASLLAPEGTVLGAAEEVRFASPLKQLKHAAVAARIECVAQRATGGTSRVHCRLTTRFVGPDGKVHGEPRLHFEASLTFGPVRPAQGSAAPACSGEHQRSAIYPPFFHGPSFQVLDAAGPLGDAAVARFHEPREPHFGAGAAKFLTLPMVGEALFQVCGLRTLATERVMSLPAGVERVEVLHHGPLPEGITLVSRYVGRTPEGLRKFDAEAVGDGHVLLRLHGYTMVETGAADAGSLAAKPAATNGATAVNIAGAEVLLPQSDEVHYAAVAVSTDPATKEHFTPQELEKYGKFPAPKRRHEWRAGRLAAKKAILETHAGLRPQDVEIAADERTGRPRLMIQGQESALWISLTHREGLAVAAVSPAPVGIDLETFEDRPRSFLEEAFSVGELRGLLEAADPKFDVACMWAAKEAALKRAGVGLRSDLRAHHVSADNQGGAVVEGPTGRFGIRFFDLGGQVLAVSAPHLDPDLKAQAGIR